MLRCRQCVLLEDVRALCGCKGSPQLFLDAERCLVLAREGTGAFLRLRRHQADGRALLDHRRRAGLPCP